MALINCSECDKEISSQAKKCPHCGYVGKTISSMLVTIIKYAVIGSVFFYVWTIFFYSPDQEGGYATYNDKVAEMDRQLDEKYKEQEMRLRETELKKAELEKRKLEAKQLEEVKLKTAIANLDASFSWKKASLGTVLQVTAIITNNNNFSIKDMEVGCGYFGNSGTFLADESQVIYDIIGTTDTKTFTDITIGFLPKQTARVGCAIINLDY